MAKAGVRMMHRLLLATVATISLVLAAGDVTPARAAPPVPYSWTGFYVGGNFGGGWGNTGYSGGHPRADGTGPLLQRCQTAT